MIHVSLHTVNYSKNNSEQYIIYNALANVYVNFSETFESVFAENVIIFAQFVSFHLVFW